MEWVYVPESRVFVLNLLKLEILSRQMDMRADIWILDLKKKQELLTYR